MELKEKLVDLRKKKGLSQAELSEVIKVSRQAISRWEVGTAIPSADNLMWLSKFYEVSMDELMGTAVNSENPLHGEEQTTKPKIVFSKEIAIVVCVLAVFISIVWRVISDFRNQKIDEVPVSMKELDSNDISSMDKVIIDEDFEEGKVEEINKNATKEGEKV